jgi:hypothetical protein
MKMQFYYGDVYPNYPITTRLMTVAEPEDQQALVDDEELAHQNPPKVHPAKHQSIWLSLSLILAVIVFFSIEK